MIKFNENHIVGNYIKQLLATFNLPKYENGQYMGVTDSYAWGTRILNKTKTLQIKNNIYDSYTHEYLGDYLRFLKYYKGIDLMPLYNCFSNKLCLNFSYSKKAVEGDTVEITFNAEDPAYKIYMLPVRLGINYTIAIDSNLPVELCVSSYGKYQSEESRNQGLIRYSYKKLETSSFCRPILYTAMTELPKVDPNDRYGLSILDFAKKTEHTLKLMIKLPKDCKSSVVILEGDHRVSNDATIQFTNTRLDRNSNHSIINFGIEEVFSETDPESFELINRAEQPIPLSTPLQLLYLNTGVQHPFADRLVEYLTGNAITPDDELLDNIKRVQKTMELNGFHFSTEGIWTEAMRKELYAFMTRTSENWNSLDVYGINHDILGYVDKDTEKFYKGQSQDNYGNKIFVNDNPVYTTLANIDIYPDIYKDSKVKEGK